MYMRCRLVKLVRSLFVMASAAAIVSACANASLDPTPQFVSGDASVKKQRGKDRVYRIGIGDKLKISVFGEDNLSGEFEVNNLGQVSLPLVGDQPAQGLTLKEFRDQYVRLLSDGYLKNPKVTADILNYRPIYVHGEVKNGGEFKFKSGLTLRDAVAMAGGYTYRAEESYVYIGREGERDVSVKTPSDIVILPGDNIRVPERFF